MERDKLMTFEAFVIEKTINGIVVRPHRGWWHGDSDRPSPVNEVRVFTNLHDFMHWFSKHFPKEKPSE